MIALKPGVTLLGIAPQMLVALSVAEAVYAKRNLDCVITSGNDGRHSSKSKHYAGCALDFRTRTLQSDDEARAVAAEIKDALGIDYDVIFEGDHIHVEYEARRPSIYNA